MKKCVKLAITHVTQGLVLRLRLWHLLRWMLAVNSTVLSDGPGLKHFNFEFGILHGPRQPVVKNAAGLCAAVRLGILIHVARKEN